jgi:hypothetical protein
MFGGRISIGVQIEAHQAGIVWTGVTAGLDEENLDGLTAQDAGGKPAQHHTY